MILQELYHLYHRLCESGEPMPRPGMSKQKISFRVIIRPSGELVRIEDARDTEIITKKSKKGVTEKTVLVMRELLVPGEGKPSGKAVNPCFLWDNPAYLLGCEAVKDRALEYFDGLKEKHLKVEHQINSPAYSAVCRFLEQWDPARCADCFTDPELYTGNGVFMIEGDFAYVHEDRQILDWWQSVGAKSWRGGGKKEKEAEQGMCLITGKPGPIAALHDPAIKGVAGAQSTGAKLVSFNLSAFESYGKEQSENSPVSEYAAFAYCNALNYLMNRDTCRTRIGDATVVFWTDAPENSTADELEMLIAVGLDSGKIEAMDSALAARISLKLKDIAKGKQVLDDVASSVRFFILGLSPNAARLSVRFFHTGTMGDFVHNLQTHYAAMELQPRGGKFDDPAIISPYMILRETARESKEIPPLLGGSLMRSILQGLPYPDSIAMAILRRFRADRRVNYIRCAFLKAWLTRKSSTSQLQPMLDESNTQTGYVLGRLFAVLCKTQDDALPNLNRTVRDSFYASASAAPRSVFPRILKTYNHHLAKLEGGRRVNREKLMQEVMSHITTFPAHLSLEHQGLFALGFYHQTQAFFTSSKQEN